MQSLDPEDEHGHDTQTDLPGLRQPRGHLSQLTCGSDPVPDGPESIIAVDVNQLVLIPDQMSPSF